MRAAVAGAVRSGFCVSVCDRGAAAGGENDERDRRPGKSEEAEDRKQLGVKVRQVISSAGRQDSSQGSIGSTVSFLYGEDVGVRLGFGCASLMRVPTRRGREALLGEAFEQGIRHFDVARMYGLGAAESELGRFARGRRDEISIATKFGIEPGAGAGRLAALQAPARAALNRFPALRARVKRRQEAFHRAGRHDPESARASLETSLRELGTDYVDVFFVHDPAAIGPGELDELAGALEDLRTAGRIRAWGFSGEPDPCGRLAREAGREVVAQLRDDVLDPVPGLARRPRPALTFGVLARALPVLQELVRRDPQRWRAWGKETGIECEDAGALADLLLREALDRNPHGGTIFASTRRERIAAAAAAGRGEGAAPPLDRFRAELARILSPEGGEFV
ncbi:MAG TPA: aldo/keto reductase [Solirubrobacterales bacterium]|nr:aldo/keto reductase [Solirubrobacterales bacterium]